MTRSDSDGNKICKQCADDHYQQCEDCGYYYESDIQTIELINSRGNLVNRTLCTSCEEEYHVCESCETRMHRHGAFFYGDDAYCRSCYDERFFTCLRCGEHFDREDMEESNGASLCHGCFLIYQEGELINNYSFKPDPIFYPTYEQNQRFFGVELEIECPDDRRSNRQEIARSVKDIIGSYAYMKDDGSLSNGIEIVTHPCTLEFHLSTFPWQELLSKLSFLGCKSHETNTCGLHIHTNRSLVSEIDQIKLALIVNKNIEQMVRLSRRNPSSYAAFKDTTNGKGRIHRSRDRYEAVNYCNRRTIEFRSFKGTLKLESLLAAIETVDALLTTASRINVCQALSPDAMATFHVSSQGYKYLPQYIEDKKVFQSGTISFEE